MSINVLKSTYINYYSPGQDDPSGIRLVTLNGKDCKVFYKTDYNTYIPNAINYIIGLLGHWGRKNSRPEKHVFISNKRLAQSIGVSYSHASKVMDQIEEIFNLNISHEKGRGRARTVKISKTLIDFMKVFNDDDLEEFIIQHNISSQHRFGIQQVYRYLGWGIAPAQLTKDEKHKRRQYISDEERRNFWHYASTSNEKPESRIELIQDHKNKLSESQQQQFENLKAAFTPGERMSIYWHRVLIKLQQIVSWLIRQDKQSEEKQDTSTSVNNENLNKEPSVALKSATMESRKVPEDSSTVGHVPQNMGHFLRFAGQVILSWNERAERNNLPTVARLTEKRSSSLLALLEEYSESEILQALSKLEYIHKGEKYAHKFTFERFTQIDTILYVLEYDSTSIIAEDRDVMDQMTDNWNIRMRMNQVPEFTSIKELNSWMKENTL